MFLTSWESFPLKPDAFHIEPSVLLVVCHVNVKYPFINTDMLLQPATGFLSGGPFVSITLPPPVLSALHSYAVTELLVVS